MHNDLLSLGEGNGSANESIKLASQQLRGTIGESLTAPGGSVSAADEQLLKFHGTYQEEDRDQRQARKAAGLEKAYEFMVRTRIPGGALTAEQYLAHDVIADRHGNGSLRLTTRQGIQLHGVLKGELHATIKAINDSLLTTLATCGDVNRNVMACPAPAQSRAHELVQEYAHRIAMQLAPKTRAYHELWLNGEPVPTGAQTDDDEPLYGKTYLPRKFKIGVAYPGDNCIDVYTQDIGLVAELDSAGEIGGFTVLIGGGMGSTHGKTETYPRLASPLCFARPNEVLEIAETIVTIQRDYGDRKNRKHARMKYLVEELGIAWFRSELETRLGRRVEDPHAFEFAEANDHLGWQQQLDGSWSLGIYVENGRVVDSTRALVRSALRETIAQFKPGLRITAQQNIILTDIPAEQRGDLERALREYGVEADPKALGLRRRAMACPALPTCSLAVAEAERALPDLVTAIERELNSLGLGNEPVSIRMTGCPNGCARPRMGDIGIVGRSLGIYDVFLGGDAPNTRMNSLYAQGLKQDAIVSALARVFEVWRIEREPGESLGDFTHRFSVDRLKLATAELKYA